jgi:hypothetical protein
MNRHMQMLSACMNDMHMCVDGCANVRLGLRISEVYFRVHSVLANMDWILVWVYDELMYLHYLFDSC